MKWRWPLVIAAAVVALLVVGWFGLVEPIRVHRDWGRRVTGDIRTLAHKRPPDVSEDGWEHLVSWTHNLHGNCGTIHQWVEPGWRDGFAAEFERRLAGSITVADIDWIWDEYAAHTKGGRSYDRYRPTRSGE